MKSILTSIALALIARLTKWVTPNVTPSESTQTEPHRVVDLVRLHDRAYEKLEKELGSTTYVGPNTTDAQVAYGLGVQHVLHKLRAGYVVD